MRSRANLVGAALANFVDYLNPDLVVLGGGLVEAMPSLIRREVRCSIGAARLAQDMLNGASPIKP